MDRKYWEQIAPDYDEEIFDVLENDKRGLIRSAIKRAGSRAGSVIDIGCAVGKWLPFLSPLFKKIYAADISAKNLSIAKHTHGHLSNIEYIRADMSAEHPQLPVCNVGVCINAILTDSLVKRKRFFRNLSRCIKRNGTLVLVLPSLESYLLTQIIARRWKIDSHVLSDKISGTKAIGKWKNILQGNADIDNVPTKHYLREELSLLLTQEDFEVREITKIEYEWSTEFLKPPRWLKEPRPWDWMVVARKNKQRRKITQSAQRTTKGH